MFSIDITIYIQDKSKALKFKIDEPFAVHCVRSGEQGFQSKDVEKLLGEVIFNQSFKVDLTNPKTIVYADVVGHECIIGIDLTPKPLHKREYRIKSHNQSPNACVAYAMVRLSGYSSKSVLLDPFCKDGVIVIEAASFASKTPQLFYTKKGKFKDIDEGMQKSLKLKINGFDTLFHNIRSGEINSKLAGVNKLINWGRFDVEWLDTKFDENAVDCIVTSPPFVSRTSPEKDVRKVYKEFFHQAEYILKGKGKLIALAPKLDLFLEYAQDKFKLLEERKVKVGGMGYTLFVLERVKE